MILLTDWKAGNFVKIPSNCLFSNMPCWQTVSKREQGKSYERGWSQNTGPSAAIGTVAQHSESTLTSSISVIIDSAWKSPHLVYWYDNQINGDIQITAKADKGLQPSIWENLGRYSIRGQSLSISQWNMDALDLGRFKGQKIIIKFSADIILPPSNSGNFHPAINKWHLQKILILPDYRPGMENELSSVASMETAGTSPAVSSTQALTGTSSSEPLLLTDWRTSSLSTLSAGCKFPDQVCWASVKNAPEDNMNVSGSVSNHSKGPTQGQVQSSLIGKTTFYIDPAWSNPQLVFWYDDPFPGDLFVSVKLDLNWKTLAHIPLNGRGLKTWKTASVDLSQLKGKHILLSISALLSLPKYALQNNSSAVLNRWHIQNIQLIPNFTGTP